MCLNHLIFLLYSWGFDLCPSAAWDQTSSWAWLKVQPSIRSGISSWWSTRWTTLSPGSPPTWEWAGPTQEGTLHTLVEERAGEATVWGTTCTPTALTDFTSGQVRKGLNTEDVDVYFGRKIVLFLYLSCSAPAPWRRLGLFGQTKTH